MINSNLFSVNTFLKIFSDENVRFLPKSAFSYAFFNRFFMFSLRLFLNTY